MAAQDRAVQLEDPFARRTFPDEANLPRSCMQELGLFPSDPRKQLHARLRKQRPFVFLTVQVRHSIQLYLGTVRVRCAPRSTNHLIQKISLELGQQQLMRATHKQLMA